MKTTLIVVTLVFATITGYAADKCQGTTGVEKVFCNTSVAGKKVLESAGSGAKVLIDEASKTAKDLWKDHGDDVKKISQEATQKLGAGIKSAWSGLRKGLGK